MFETEFKDSAEMDISDFCSIVVETAVQLFYNLDFLITGFDVKNKMEMLQFCQKYNLSDLQVSLKRGHNRRGINGMHVICMFWFSKKPKNMSFCKKMKKSEKSAMVSKRSESHAGIC